MNAYNSTIRSTNIAKPQDTTVETYISFAILTLCVYWAIFKTFYVTPYIDTEALRLICESLRFTLPPRLNSKLFSLSPYQQLMLFTSHGDFDLKWFIRHISSQLRAVIVTSLCSNQWPIDRSIRAPILTAE